MADLAARRSHSQPRSIATGRGFLPSERGTQTVATTAPLDWKHVESSDYVAYVRNLRDIGCPEEAIRDIILADVNKYYALRMQELLPTPVSATNFWEPSKPLSARVRVQLETQLAAIQGEKRRTLQTLLGPGFSEPAGFSSGSPALVEQGGFETDWRKAPDAALDFLPVEKRDAFVQVAQRYQFARQALYAEAEAQSMAPDWQRLRELKQQHDRDLATLLSPGELEQFELRYDPVAESMRRDLLGFAPTADEFRALFKILQDVDRRFAFTPPEDEAAQASRLQAQRDATQDIKAALGEQRYAEYERTANPGFHQLCLLVNELGLPPDTATKVYDNTEALRHQWETLQQNAALTEADRGGVLKSLQAQTEATLRQNLGDSGYLTYQRRDINRLIQN